MKLRELGGCRVLVLVLQGTQYTALHNRVVNSLLQFMYDNHSLNVLMSCGLIFSLLRFVENHISGLQGKQICSKEEKDEEPDQPGVVELVEKDEVPGDSSDEKEAEKDEIEDVETRDKETRRKPSGHVFRLNSPSYQAVQYELEQFLQMRESRGAGSPRWGAASPRSGAADYSPASPSSLLQSPDRSPPHLSCGYSPDRFNLSPGTSGFSSPIDCSYSPPSPSPPSPFPMFDLNPPASPPYSPPDAQYSPLPAEPAYSPVETFSDEEDEDDSTQQVGNMPTQPPVDKDSTQKITLSTTIPIVNTCTQSSLRVNQAENTKFPKQGRSLSLEIITPEPCSSKPQIPHDTIPAEKTEILSALKPSILDTFISPVSPDTTSNPEKKIRLSSLNIPTYKYSASPILSPLVPKLGIQRGFQVRFTSFISGKT